MCFFFQAEDGIRDLVRSRGLGDVYKRQDGGRYGTMMGLYDARWSNFGGYIGSIIVDYGRIASGGGDNFIAAHGLGAWVDSGAQGQYVRTVVKPKVKGLTAYACLLYTSDAADDLLCVDLGGRRILKKKTNQNHSISPKNQLDNIQRYVRN